MVPSEVSNVTHLCGQVVCVDLFQICLISFDELSIHCLSCHSINVHQSSVDVNVSDFQVRNSRVQRQLITVQVPVQHVND